MLSPVAVCRYFPSTRSKAATTSSNGKDEFFRIFASRCSLILSQGKINNGIAAEPLLHVSEDNGRV